MKNAVTLEIRGLKCDNPSCDYRDESIELEEYKSYINAPCPKCGSSLLTQEDYDQVQKILSLTNMVNSLPSINGESSDPVARVSFELNGTGDMEIKIEKV